MLCGVSYWRIGSSFLCSEFNHYSDVIMITMASQITSLTIVYRWPVNSPSKGPVTRKMFPFDDVIMYQGITISIFVIFCVASFHYNAMLFAKRLWLWTLDTWNFDKNTNFSFTKMHLQISSVKWWPFCPGGNELIDSHVAGFLLSLTPIFSAAFLLLIITGFLLSLATCFVIILPMVAGYRAIVEWLCKVLL